MEENRLKASSSPHIRSDESVNKIMLDVLIALLPAFIASIFYFGVKSLILVVASVLSAVITEALCQKIMKRPITIGDLSAIVTGVLLAFNLPSTTPVWMPVIGSAFAIAIGKQVFGGLGQNFINPALAGRAVLFACWPALMGNYVAPLGIDAVATATPLAILKGTADAGLQMPGLLEMFIGRIPGCIGETSAVLLIIGGIYLIVRKVISWRIPVAYIGTVAVIALISEGNLTGMSYYLFAGGLMLGAFFMATDYATSPVTPKGKIIYGIGAGVLTMLIRKLGGYPEGVSYSILLMNVATPLIDKYTSPKIFGGAK
ncbi:RnfABCDGE type electron transport complex subunit D [Sedimentibacter sp. zth1]|uniref:RnfABCDGE type electron transport complex subunit D n=1 Tax=Sedimentibacter sp. zth1 TaxID=2816908 RepID=UPI001A9397DC|nr:RnfABCDGE type electron transport complex subunit D [Sedimentibacter sp. zth1]QSX06203.1 RnfABCDGE type electron transport complex subunit D [Sedimentibacter sp. zth1]